MAATGGGGGTKKPVNTGFAGNPGKAKDDVIAAPRRPGLVGDSRSVSRPKMVAKNVTVGKKPATRTSSASMKTPTRTVAKRAPAGPAPKPPAGAPKPPVPSGIKPRAK